MLKYHNSPFCLQPFHVGFKAEKARRRVGGPSLVGGGGRRKASFGAKPRHRHHRHIGTGCLGPRAPSLLVVRVLSGAVPSSKTHTVPLSSFVRRTGPRVPFENYPVYIGGGRGGGFYDADLALLLIFLQQGTLTHSKLTQYRPLVRIFSFSFKSKINLLPKVVKNLPATSGRKIFFELGSI